MFASSRSYSVLERLPELRYSPRARSTHSGVSAGGVYLNVFLNSGYRVFAPPRALCTDNAVMIGLAAHAWRLQGRSSSLTLTADANAVVEAAGAALTPR